MRAFSNLNHWMVFIFFIMTGPASFLWAEATDHEKADCIFNLIHFVNWPEQDPQADPKSPIYIGVVGSEGLDNALESKVNGKTVDGRTLEVEGFRSVDASQAEKFKRCNVIYITPKAKASVPDLMKLIKGSSALTVSDIKNFNNMNGMVELGEEGGKIVFQVNLTPVSSSGLFLSSKFLHIAKTSQRPEYFNDPFAMHK